MEPDSLETCKQLEVSDQDILEAMREFQGYLDITAADFKELYLKAFRHALARLGSTRTAGEIMTRQVAWVEQEAPLPQVAQLLDQRGVSGAPVLDKDGKVAGIISQRDFLRLMGGGQARSFMGVAAACLGQAGCLVGHLRDKQARDIMSSPARCVKTGTSLAQLAQMMAGGGINRLPVVDDEGRLLGIVSRADLLRVTAGR